ncbi:DUF2490 domain-containing protein [Pedobacter sp.]|uniref:DUF2490 domain-containing protein n=1 Tax=Pedobacter sp. TaxID=1411316 RepID=UPI003D7F2AF1
MRKYLLMCLAFFAMSFAIKAQTVDQNSGWLFLMNSTKFNDKWGMHFDVQLRSQDNWDGVKNLLVRPGITYYINKSSDVTLGYLYSPTFVKSAGHPNNTLVENRIWEQYIYKHKLSFINVSHRFRLEQRFMERQGADDLFSQRARYFLRLMAPLNKVNGSFEKGVFVALQNEVFLNVQNKEELNGSLFDQNRVYGAAGYRISPKVDLEAGYMNQSINGKTNNTRNHIVQVALYTRF